MQNILKLKSLILILGVTIALSVVAVPVLKNTAFGTVNIEKSQKQSDNDKESQQTSVAEFQAVAPAAQSDYQSDNELFKYLLSEVKVIEHKSTVLVQEASQKFFKILFRVIISPNAP